ncbi:IS91 family transposase, partial [Escherichia coli]|nr:IS91 family transposase [Escherichia coli]
PLTDLGGKTSIFSHPVYLFLREFSLQDFRGGSVLMILCRSAMLSQN